jgi:hypothetical protein
VNLKGLNDSSIVQQAHHWMTEQREHEAIRLCLKHFRQKNYIEAFETLRKKTKIPLEDELLTKLYEVLVVQGQFDRSEQMIDDCVRKGLFDEYIKLQPCRPVWNEFVTLSRDTKPGMRGGHQMCVDPHGDSVYLFGGWNGKNDLSDLWMFDLNTRLWKCLFENCSNVDGPDPRSCHKMCFDTKRKRIFVLGRYLDSAVRSGEKVKVRAFARAALD